MLVIHVRKLDSDLNDPRRLRILKLSCLRDVVRIRNASRHAPNATSDDCEVPIHQHGKTFRMAVEHPIDQRAIVSRCSRPHVRGHSHFNWRRQRQVDRLLVPLGQTTVITLRAVLMKRSANKLRGLGLSFCETGHNYMKWDESGDKALYGKPITNTVIVNEGTPTRNQASRACIYFKRRQRLLWPETLRMSYGKCLSTPG